MKTIRFNNFVILTILALVAVAYPQTTKPSTVTDFYFLLPAEYFAKPNFDKWRKMNLREYRESAIKIKDIKNGYLRIEEPVRDGWAEMAIFKQTDGNYIVGVTEVDCGPGCEGKITFLQYNAGSELGWYNMTNSVMPEISDSRIKAALKRHLIRNNGTELVYVLPRVGTTIKVQTPGDYFDIGFKPTVLFELDWIGWRFVVKDR
ncbi:MAG TPA: hypothetical protein VL325_00685 [Pyrinomonadaceae bacterium]|jgi:hypothetical protein|nr:hypothetical protein [Pyrinomonadaceae bacterium]